MDAEFIKFIKKRLIAARKSAWQDPSYRYVDGLDITIKLIDEVWLKHKDASKPVRAADKTESVGQPKIDFCVTCGTALGTGGTDE